MNPFFTDYSEFLKNIFPGTKVQKISVNIGSGCPNRDGTLGTGGCIYCNNSAFTPAYCFEKDGVKSQLSAGKSFFARKYADMKYLAYFQSFTSTYSTERFRRALREAIECEDIVGIVAGTRPDCLDKHIIEDLKTISRTLPVMVEIGVESLHDKTLALINRGHDASCAIAAIHRLADAGLHPGVHLIAGLPSESDAMVMDTVSRITELPVEIIKLHQLQVLRGSKLENIYMRDPEYLHLYSLEEYINLCAGIVNIVPRHIAIDRFLSQAPPEMVIAPKWGIKNHEFTNMLINHLRHKNKPLD